MPYVESHVEVEGGRSRARAEPVYGRGHVRAGISAADTAPAGGYAEACSEKRSQKRESVIIGRW